MRDEGDVEAFVVGERCERCGRCGRRGSVAGCSRRRIGRLSDHVNLVADRRGDVEWREIVQDDEAVGEVEARSGSVVDEDVAIEIGAGERDDDGAVGETHARRAHRVGRFAGVQSDEEIVRRVCCVRIYVVDDVRVVSEADEDVLPSKRGDAVAEPRPGGCGADDGDAQRARV